MDRIDAIDQLNQVRDELSTIWMALGNTTDMTPDTLLDIREALNWSTNRMCHALDALQGRSA